MDELFICFAGIVVLGLFVAAFIGLGWFVVQPLGRINRVRVVKPRFQISDLFWIMILLQPSLWLFTALLADPHDRHNYNWGVVAAIFALAWGGTLVAWAVIAGVLSEAGVTSSAKRAAAQLILLPMIAAVNPAAIVLLSVSIVTLFFGDSDLRTSFHAISIVGGACVFAVALFGCRGLSRWIASGVSITAKKE